ncbi:MAG: tyrosine-type recombinase/integrase [Hyphomonadaceae bacterium]
MPGFHVRVSKAGNASFAIQYRTRASQPRAITLDRPREGIKRAWDRIRERAGLEDFRLHDLRHSFASIAVNAGLSLEAIGKALDHKDTRTTQRYAHLTDQTVRHVSTTVADAFARGASK